MPKKSQQGKNRCLLTIDAGNTEILIGLFEAEKLALTHRIRKTHLKQDLPHFFKRIPQRPSGSIISSVVPSLTGYILKEVRKACKIDPMLLTSDVPLPIKIGCKNPKEVGTDRIANAVAAHILFGGPVIVVDLGTAITFDCVSGDGEYLGGAISPGVRLGTEFLWRSTEQLPRIERLSVPETPIGKTTQEALSSGLFFGFLGLIHGVLSEIKKELKDSKTILTGGDSSLFGAYLKIDKIEPFLVLKGLKIVHNYQRGVSLSQ